MYNPFMIKAIFVRDILYKLSLVGITIELPTSNHRISFAYPACCVNACPKVEAKASLVYQVNKLSAEESKEFDSHPPPGFFD